MQNLVGGESESSEMILPDHQRGPTAQSSDHLQVEFERDVPRDLKEEYVSDNDLLEGDVFSWAQLTSRDKIVKGWNAAGDRTAHYQNLDLCKALIA